MKNVLAAARAKLVNYLRTEIKIDNWSIVQRHKWSPTANDPQTENDPQIGPEMIPNLKWSSMWAANDPARK